MSEHEVDAATAVARVAATIEAVQELETCPVTAAPARILGADIVASVDVPAFDNAAMDGYAVRSIDCAAPTRLRVIGRALAGHAFSGELQPGQAVRIMTGAAVPPGADAVVMQEDVEVTGDGVTIANPPAAGLNVRLRGEHVRRDSVVLPRGRRMQSYDVGLAAACGATQLALVRRLRVGVLSTGDELHDAPALPGPSGQYDGNRPLLISALARSGYQATDLGIVADRAEMLSRALDGAARARLDAVLSTGGVAQGDADIVRRFPSIEFVPLSLRPGRGIACGRVVIDGHPLWLFGMPGNSVAAYLMYQLIVAPLLARLAGADPEAPLTLQLPLAVDARTRPGRVDWRRGRFIRRYGGVAVEPLAHQGSSMLRTLSEADALIGIGPEAETRSGELVDVIPLAALP